MTREVRTVVFDTGLQLEAYQFEGIMQKFPNHFHDYYVIGFIEQGKRHLVCNNEEYMLNSGDMIVFNPHDPHACEQVDGRTLDYRCINIQPEVMREYAREITGQDYLPRFRAPVLYQNELVSSLHELHLMILEEQSDFGKEELLLLLLEQLLRDNADAEPPLSSQDVTIEIKRLCEYIESHYMDSITLNELAELTGMSKYHLIRRFTRQKGISPYRYLETIRINHAKRLLEQGQLPIEVAAQTGFSDQSHFTNFFKKLIGLTPKQYRRIFNHEVDSKRLRDSVLR
ncbi:MULTISPECIES: AraC family ligand binding domain-containing protein [Paenibacillus]|uniref:AraC family transcriptional regulator n=1 Tax=Paenibacillus xylanilyticus TaxID=248903 RepID=A0A7Y6C4U7_9BACL|nr:AraC family transcriptional regulator [Paenibacillus xylanilyticus]NUU79534.1 AraC family transcriptional regulator [Paenibacillus xylanilyticus]